MKKMLCLFSDHRKKKKEDPMVESIRNAIISDKKLSSQSMERLISLFSEHRKHTHFTKYPIPNICIRSTVVNSHILGYFFGAEVMVYTLLGLPHYFVLIQVFSCNYISSKGCIEYSLSTESDIFNTVLGNKYMSPKGTTNPCIFFVLDTQINKLIS